MHGALPTYVSAKKIIRLQKEWLHASRQGCGTWYLYSHLGSPVLVLEGVVLVCLLILVTTDNGTCLLHVISQYAEVPSLFCAFATRDNSALTFLSFLARTVSFFTHWILHLLLYCKTKSLIWVAKTWFQTEFRLDFGLRRKSATKLMHVYTSS